jgi:hypothetical protein
MKELSGNLITLTSPVMLWHEQLDTIEQYIKRIEGANFNLVQSEACGWYTSLTVFGEPDKSVVTRDYLDKADAIGYMYQHLLTNY